MLLQNKNAVIYFERLTAAGVEFKDPEGNIVQLLQPAT